MSEEHKCPKCNVELEICPSVMICPKCYNNYFDGKQQMQVKEAAQYMSIDKITAGLQKISDEEREKLQKKQERAESHKEIIDGIFKSRTNILSTIADVLKTNDPIKAMKKIIESS
jgi:hypothetical protein